MFAGVGLDRDFKGAHVEVDATVLEFFRFVDAPGRLTRDAEARMVDDDEEFAVGFEVGGCVLEGSGGIFEVLCDENHRSVGKIFFFQAKRMGDVGDVKRMFRFGFGSLNEGRGCVDADIFDMLWNRSREDSLAAAEVKE